MTIEIREAKLLKIKVVSTLYAGRNRDLSSTLHRGHLNFVPKRSLTKGYWEFVEDI